MKSNFVIFYFKLFTIYILSILYIVIGVKHFLDPVFFMSIMPPMIPLHRELVYLSGFFEIILGCMLLFPKTRLYASYALILLLIFVFPANIYLYLSETPREILGVSKHQALIRMPFQLPLIIIAYWHSLINSSNKFDLIAIFLFFPTIIYFLTLSL